MNIWFENKSTLISDAEIQSWLPGFHQYATHIRSWWGTMLPALYFGTPTNPDAWQIQFVDQLDVSGALGYHDLTPSGRPISYIGVGDDLQYGYDPQITTAHEFAEMLLDPYVRRGDQVTNTRWYALELCDPVEADEFGYAITVRTKTIKVSDFVTPYWFQPEMKGKPGAVFSHKRHATAPLQVTPGGYAYYFENGEWWAIDAQGKASKAAELPERRRLQLYARDKGE